MQCESIAACRAVLHKATDLPVGRGRCWLMTRHSKLVHRTQNTSLVANQLVRDRRTWTFFLVWGYTMGFQEERVFGAVIEKK